MALTLTQQPDTEQTRQEWERQTAGLAGDVAAWAESAAGHDWLVTREEKELAEEMTGGAYRVPVVTISAPQARLILEPIARGTIGAQGRVDLYA